ncbi:DUF1592 domain-containing protein [Marinagarivorans algicola]|uniref:DUF1592 domain-containing protein n=1 Tax=Marinagarivorans algicola TaxID=1513270 RepID=UPI0012E23F05|nr:DUF1592 domain-containing protein [Marinagarivorans algicola]
MNISVSMLYIGTKVTLGLLLALLSACVAERPSDIASSSESGAASSVKSTPTSSGAHSSNSAAETTLALALERGKAQYIAQCEGCHGATGAGEGDAFGGPINGDCQFTNCQNLAILTAYIETDMPWKGAAKCSDTNGQTCATDIALYMHDQIVTFVDFSQDNDGDGLIDAEDACPNTSADKVLAIDSRGCAQDNLIHKGVFAINAGGQAYTSINGTQFIADDAQYYTGSLGSSGGNPTHEVANTQDDPLYRKERWGKNLHYTIPVSSGRYRVILHLAEVHFNEANQRVMDVVIEGTQVLSGYDIFQVAGGKHVAKREVLPPVNVTDNELLIELKGIVNNASLVGLEVVELLGNDGDDDGIVDELDRCPGSRNTQSINDSGCAPDQLDSDNDGISDDIDQLCPNTAAGEPVDASGDFPGCSAAQKIADTDNDGVYDIADKCLDSAIAVPVDTKGCPLLDTLSAPQGFTAKRFVNGIQFSWSRPASPVSYWIVQRWDPSLSEWQTLARVPGDTFNYQARQTPARGRFQLYAVTDDIASFPAQFVAGKHDLTIASKNYGGTADSGFFEYTQVNGDFDARVFVDIPDAGTLWRWERGGLMARESLDAGSRYIGVWAAAGVAPTGTKRDKTNENSENYVGDKFGTLSFPKEIRLTRVNNTFTWYEFRDNAWRKIHSYDFVLPAQVYVGLPSGSRQRIMISYDGFQINGQFQQSLDAQKFGSVNSVNVVNYSDIKSDLSTASLRPDVKVSRVVHITRDEYINFISAIFPGEEFAFDLSTDDSTTGYSVGSNISLLSVERYQSAAEKLAKQVAPQLVSNSACDFDEGVACLREFIKDYGLKFYRKPLRQEQIDNLILVYADIAGRFGKEEGVKAVIESMAQSPQFLYKFELSPADMDKGTIVPVTGYEMATRLAATLWSSVPDEELLRVARQGELVTPQQIKAQAQRMVSDVKARGGFKQFYRQWLHLDRISKIDKDVGLFPDFTPAVALALETAASAFVDHIVFSNAVPPTLNNLLTAPLVATNQTLDFITGAGESREISVAASGSTRTGLLGQPGILSMLALDTQTSIVARGVFINEQIMCEHFKAPPAGVPSIKDIDKAGKTAREVLDELTQAPACDGCHKFINPVGGALEGFDALGREREMDNGLMVDTFATIVAQDDKAADHDIDGLVELNSLLASLDQVKACVATQYLNYAAGRIPGAEDSQSITRLVEAMQRENWDLRKMMVEMTQTDIFLYRQVP